jgi:hypothetical protein
MKAQCCPSREEFKSGLCKDCHSKFLYLRLIAKDNKSVYAPTQLEEEIKALTVLKTIYTQRKIEIINRIAECEMWIARQKEAEVKRES